MPAWIVAALALLAPLAMRALPAVRGAVLPATAGGLGGFAAGGGFGAEDFIGVEEKKRRRRRRALTASDRADIAFIEGILGKSAGKSFAMIIAAKI